MSNRRLSDDDFILLGKGLSFCPKSKSHDKIKLAEELFKYARRLRLKEFFYESDQNQNAQQKEYTFSELPFFNKRQSTFTPPTGRDVYLDFYIEAISQELFQAEPKAKFHSNMSKSEFASLQSLARDSSIVIKKADKSGTIVIMNKSDYIAEVERQLNNSEYYEKLDSDPSEEVKSRISDCIVKMSLESPNICDVFDTFPSEIRTPMFYILPKTHKDVDTNLPLGYPGRPIVSACSSSTDNISKYVDYTLKPLMQSLPSYVKDTTDFIQKLKSFKLAHANSYLVTLDVSSLYTNIPHEDGLDACRFFLTGDSHNFKELSVDSILRLIRLVLENNHFQFNKDNYLQIKGTAMGSPMAPAYASLFMGKLEQDFLKDRFLRPSIWLRFLDDIFMIWDHSLESLHSFIDALNSFHPSIKFTYNISPQKVSFLDVTVSKSENLDLATDVYVKSTNVHQYVEYSSCHPKSCKDGIPYSQGKRYRRIISNDTKFKESIPQLRDFFLERNYPAAVLDEALAKVSSLTQVEALQTSVKNEDKNAIPFVIEYNPSLPNIGLVINKYWDLLQLSQKSSVKAVHTYKPILAYRRPKNLRDYLVHSSFVDRTDHFSQACGRRRCSHCKNIIKTDVFTSTNTQAPFKMRYATSCTSQNVIYLIECKRCKMQYIGQTNQQVSKRMNSHRFDINNYDGSGYGTNVALHFNSDSHSLDDFSFVPIDVVNKEMDRLCKETYWIHKLDTLHPKGMNSKLLYTIK